MTIAFNRLYLHKNTPHYLQQSIASNHLAGDGPFTLKCQELLEQHTHTARALLTTSCTHALEMTAILIDIQPGDEVILPAYTFVSTANAFVLRGARPIFCDIRKDTLNLDETQLAGHITDKTKAIVPVHYAGVGCEMDAILGIANQHNITVIEDNAHGLFGKYKGKVLGTLGTFGTQSFHETKNFTCGEGGALLINDPAFMQRAEIIREKGTNRSRFFRGEIDKYTWVDQGSSYLPSDLLAACLLAQLEQKALIQTERKNLWDHYRRGLQAWADNNGVQLPHIPEHCEQAFHMFYMLLPNHESRQALIQHLKSKQISAPFHYMPLHLSDMGQTFGGKPGHCPVTENTADCIIRLPFYNGLTTSDQNQVIDAVLAFSS